MKNKKKKEPIFELVIASIYALCAIVFFLYPVIVDITLRTSMLFGIAGLLCLILSKLWTFNIK